MFRFTIVSGIIGIASESSHNGNWVDGKLANGIMMTIAAILFVCNGLDLIFLSLTRKIFKGMILTIRKNTDGTMLCVGYNRNSEIYLKIGISFI